ncbi:hypothetical protein [Gramella sp. MAR_2010_147]|uniref:hypothetical protein n=1 Tax=Gramella sp. MAR_2010_147 TaxID=1250205 RepID=UPI00087CB7D8|nr:hypothetical protein [Gramella sp. MAR_2010_147]SDR76828.1 hypothetical protein SAMN04488553_0613 [Gramella sp. MAR_2010_147]
MKLIKVSQTRDAYEVKVLISYRLFGIRIFSTEKSFVKKYNHDEWYQKDDHSKASQEKKMKLDKWLKDHQKFIEKI